VYSFGTPIFRRPEWIGTISRISSFPSKEQNGVGKKTGLFS
jgi:hypothetical protein